jgi:hypothetical protein
VWNKVYLLAGKTLHKRLTTQQQEDGMSAAKIAAIVLIIVGGLGLVYQQFSYTQETTKAKIGPLELSVKEKETVNVPLWMSLAAIGAGIVLLVVGGKK